MKPVTTAVAALTLTILAGPLSAQLLNFDYYTIKNGLPSNWTTYISQDSRGYLWIASSEGVSVYDGVSFANYGLQDGLPVNLVWCVIESAKQPGVLWIGTHGGGLSQLKDGRITSRKIGNTFAQNVVLRIIEDDEGGVWCASGSGLYRVLGDSVSLVSTGSDTGWVSFVEKTRSGGIFASVGTGLYRYHPEADAMQRVDLKTSAPIACLVEDQAANLWLGTAYGLIYKVRDDRIIDSLQTNFRMVSVVDDGQGYLWFATTSGLLKVSKLHFGEGEIVNYTTENGLQDNELNFCFADHESNLWFTSRNQGVSKLSERNVHSFKFEEIITDTYKAAICDARGHIFVAAKTGIWEVWKDAAGNWQKFLHDLDLPDRPQVLALSRDNELWVGLQEGGLLGFKINGEPGKRASLHTEAFLRKGRDIPENGIITLNVDRDNQLLCGIWRGSLAQVDLNLRKTVALYSKEDSLLGETVRAILPHSDGSLWVGTFRGGIHIFRKVGNRYEFVKRLLPADGVAGDRIRSMIERANGETWIGTRFNGISILKDGEFVNLTTDDGLLSNAIWALEEDAEGRVWIGTSIGVQYAAHDNPTNLQTHNRLLGRHIGSIGFVTGEPIFWGASWDELTVYEYGFESSVGAPPPVYITGLRVNGEDQPLTGAPEFEYDQNFCVIKFSGISFKDEGSLRYKYRLLGLDSDWQEPTEERLVTYASLKPGDYTFRVKAITSDGLESETPASISFKILAPFWRRWWFISLCVLLVGGVLFFWHRIRLRRLLEIEKIRSRIATDLHDDIGAGLTHIGLISEVTLRKSGLVKAGGEQSAEVNGNPVVTELSSSMQRVGGIARELSAAMSDVVWSINPKHDSMEALHHRLSSFAHEICQAKDIELHMTPADRIVRLKLHPELRRNLLLIAKEALHNMAKYSNSPSVSVSIDTKGREITLTVEDKGDGFDLNGSEKGNGLINMRMRAEKMGGQCEIVSKIGVGTRVSVTAPLQS